MYTYTNSLYIYIYVCVCMYKSSVLDRGSTGKEKNSEENGEPLSRLGGLTLGRSFR